MSADSSVVHDNNELVVRQMCFSWLKFKNSVCGTPLGIWVPTTETQLRPLDAFGVSMLPLPNIQDESTYVVVDTRLLRVEPEELTALGM